MKSPARPTGRTTTLLAGGVIGWFQFNVVYLVEGATRPGYDAVRNSVSELSLTDRGLPDVVSLVVAGILTIGLAFGVRSAWSVTRRIRWGPLLIGCIGVGLIAAGLFVTDPGHSYPPGTPASTTLHGTLHFALGVPGTFGGLTAACFTFARYLWEEHRRARSIYSIVTGVAVLGGLVGFAALAMRDGPAGLAERISFVAGLLWVALIARWSYSLYRAGASDELLAVSHRR